VLNLENSEVRQVVVGGVDLWEVRVEKDKKRVTEHPLS
jgi:hypothetical protein